MGNARTIARNSATLASAYAVTKLFSVGLTAVAARVLGPAGYGLYAMGSAFVEVGRILAGGGVPLIVTREVASHRDQSGSIAKHASILELLAGIAVYVLVLVAIVLLGYPREVLFCAVILGSAIFFENQSDIIDAVFNGFEKVGASTRAFSLGALMHFAAGVTALLGGLGLYGYCMAAVAGFAVRYLLLRVLGGRAGILKLQQNAVDRTQVVRLGKTAAPLVGAMVVSLMFHRMDILMLGRMVDHADVGRYGAAVRIVDVLVLMPRVMASVAFPAMRRMLDREGPELTSQLVAKTLRLTLVFCSAMALAVWVLAPWALRWVTGIEYVSATPTLRLLAFGVVLQAAAHVFARLLVALDRERDFLRIGTLSLLCNFVLNLWWIPRWGIHGAALATVTSYVLNASLYYAHARVRGVRVPLTRALAGALGGFAVAVVAGIVSGGGGSLGEIGARVLDWAGIGLMLAAWALLVIGLRGLVLGDAELIRGMFRRN